MIKLWKFEKFYIHWPLWFKVIITVPQNASNNPEDKELLFGKSHALPIVLLQKWSDVVKVSVHDWWNNIEREKETCSDISL